jgi:hypothetical protein
MLLEGPISFPRAFPLRSRKGIGILYDIIREGPSCSRRIGVSEEPLKKEYTYSVLLHLIATHHRLRAKWYIEWGQVKYAAHIIYL